MKITNSYYVSSSTGDKVTVRTVHTSRGDTYMIFIGGWKVATYKTTASVRRYIVKNDLHAVER